MEEDNVSKLDIGLLLPNPYQPRKKFNENSLKELALSIREYGILNPILVRKKEDKYEIIAGERRYRAAKLLGMKEMPAIVKDISDEKMIEIALIENLQRENITPIEEAITYQEILKKTSRTEKELSELIGKSQPFISNKLRLLNLPKNIQTALIDKKISERHARSLLTVKDERKQTALLERVMAEKLSVKELDNIINEKEITEEEINSAVKNIMNSLNDSEKEKEEKESDNMNNGNFFPNVNNGQDTASNQASLNSMNMQTINGGFTYNPEGQAPLAQEAVAPAPQVTPTLPQMEVPTTPSPVAPVAPAPEVLPTPEIQPMNSEPISPIPDFNMTASTPAEVAPQQPVAPEPIGDVAPVADIPLFNSPEFNQPAEVTPALNPNPTPEVTPTVEPLLTPTPIQDVAPVETAPMQETPLFNQKLAAPAEVAPASEIQPAPAYEVPVTTDAPVAGDRFTQVKELLNNNGVVYKAYSNETGNCIIIEL